MRLTRLKTALKAARQLGIRQTGWLAVYRVGLRSGLWQRMTPAKPLTAYTGKFEPPFRLPERASLERIAAFAPADRLKDGWIQRYGTAWVPVEFPAPATLPPHWCAVEQNPAPEHAGDIKDTWEAARFGWAFALGRAYWRAQNEDDAQLFWRLFEDFCTTHPPNLGVQWTSGQEVALRLIALLFAARALQESPHSTTARMQWLAGCVAAHAARIAPTLSYARAQHNNHLISEGLGLLAAGLALPEHEQAQSWQRLGLRTVRGALMAQLAPDGTYAQHSLNYHRLMLQEALLVEHFGAQLGKDVRMRLAAAARWLIAQVDPNSGHAPNYGSNDGALLLPLSEADWEDFRPTAQAAARAWLRKTTYAPGAWDELSAWLGLPLDLPLAQGWMQSDGVLRLGDAADWSILRAVHYLSRPAHADPLQVDLWHNGAPLTLDAGTFRYNAPPPWQNSLSSALVHNTITINGQEPMTRAGKFLWLDWAQGRVMERTGRRIVAEHDGYRQLGVLHRRSLEWLPPSGWRVVDELLPLGEKSHGKEYDAVLHWLLPDGDCARTNTGVIHHSGGRTVRIDFAINGVPAAVDAMYLIRAGAVVWGNSDAPAPMMGWHAPHYGEKLPALALCCRAQGGIPIKMVTDWEVE